MYVSLTYTINFHFFIKKTHFLTRKQKITIHLFKIYFQIETILKTGVSIYF